MIIGTMVSGGPKGSPRHLLPPEVFSGSTVSRCADRSVVRRRSDAIIPGLLHDDCSAIHPMAVGAFPDVSV